MDRLTFRSPKNPDCPSAFGFRTVWIFWAPSGQSIHTGPAFGGKNVTVKSVKSVRPNTTRAGGGGWVGGCGMIIKSLRLQSVSQSVRSSVTKRLIETLHILSCQEI